MAYKVQDLKKELQDQELDLDKRLKKAKNIRMKLAVHLADADMEIADLEAKKIDINDAIKGIK
jgi:hypothetical protein